MDYPKSVPSVGLVNGKFVDENPVTGQVGSLISSDWGNAVTDELLNVIRAGGKEPAEAEHDQLLAAIKAIVRDSIPPEKIRTTLAEYGITDAYTKSVTYTKAEIEALLKNMSALPVGAMVPFPKGTVPTGFLEVDGSVQSAATYPDLAAYLGTTFNTGGEGAGNFRLPESRGEFLRGWDHGRGVDTGRTLGSGQMDALQNITGTMTVYTAFGPLNSATGAFTLEDGGGQGESVAYASTRPRFTFDASRVARTADETRPRNLAVMWCIKAWNAPTNQGSIDVAALVPLAAQATETNRGTALIASQTDVNAGSSTSKIVTPRQLRLGFSISLAANGYVAFPSWLGGVIVQWGNTLPLSAGGQTTTYPLAFPNACFVVVPSVASGIAMNEYGLTVTAKTQSSFTAVCKVFNGISANQSANYIAIGF
ncbi:phage tail protein [Pseudomonas protegens]|uniref:phage tail protein n=1 Tax=Pseudomonas protegens TaxID=380021 RepID=UPI0017CFFD71|nr:tail fiber protein [Pseudomonas protegens]